MPVTGPQAPVARMPLPARLIVAVLAVPLGLLGSGALVWQASYAAFTAQTTSPGNSWSTGSVALTDDDAGAAMFSRTGLAPGSSGERFSTRLISRPIARGRPARWRGRRTCWSSASTRGGRASPRPSP